MGRVWLHRLAEDGRRNHEPLEVQKAFHAYSLAWIDADRIALRLPGLRDAPVVLVSAAEQNSLSLSGEIHPLPGRAIEAPFAHRLEGPPRIPIPFPPEGSSDADGTPVVGSPADGSPSPRGGGEPGLAELHRLSISNLSRHGEARPFSDSHPHRIDSGQVDTIWHRLHAEARLPAQTGMVVWLAATSEATPLHR